MGAGVMGDICDAVGTVLNGSFEATGEATEAHEQRLQRPTADHQGKRSFQADVGLTRGGSKSRMV